MASVNAADRGITSSHNFGSQWQMLPARQWRSTYHLSLFFPPAATDLDLDQLVLGPETLRGV